MSTESNGEIRILHLSDIHFHEPYCLNNTTDQDYPVRQALLADLRNIVHQHGQIDLIFISGDIAFKAHPNEYKEASKWLADISNIIGCSPTDIYTVPGNHDVDRGIASEADVQATRDVILTTPLQLGRDKKLIDTLYRQEQAIHLFHPMQEYNRFAASYDCDLNPERPFWLEKIDMGTGWSLHLHGLTTTLFSGNGDNKGGGLYLGACQRAFAHADGIIRIAIMHHPPDWLEDQDEIDDALREHCAIHLLGHKHLSRYIGETKCLKLGAGAVNPDRNEGRWEPAYNILTLKVKNEDETHFLNIETRRRKWQSDPDQFVAWRTEKDEDVFLHCIELTNPPPKEVEPALQKEEPECEGHEIERVPTEPGNPMGRQLIYDFWTLTPSQRRIIIQNLGVHEDEDDKLTEPYRCRLAIKRIKSKELIEEFIAEVYLAKG